MKTPRSLCWLVLLGAWLLAAQGLAQTSQPEERYPTLAVGPDTYTNVLILSKTRSDIFLKHQHGMANIKVRDLDPTTQARLGYQVEPPKQNPIQQVFQPAALNEFESDPRVQEVEEQLVAELEPFLELFDDTVVYSIVAMVVLLYLLFSYLCRCICTKTSNPPSPLIWIPVFKQIPMFKAAGMSPWWFLSMLLPPLYAIACLIWCFKIVQARGKNMIFAIMLLFPVTNLIAFFYLALSGDGSEQQDPRWRDVITLSGNTPRRDAA